uniref:NADH-ubiquinone oxidoreductase chain 2 n=2 Tax=Gammarus duebeni TaxID=178002 RepID=H9M5S2_9CRUS|nr:NADH dehydrogenase subunit 2 [Gammarus duebeni]AER12201.1 NADH dehydrogenase subunit 2 [Gammarus duebeni]
MLIHPAVLLFYVSLASSITISISASSWFIAWMGLEVNLLSFIPLLLSKKNKYTTESCLKYFLIQALASVLIIVAALTSVSSDLSCVVIGLALLMKSGAAPSHQWLPAMIDGLSWFAVSLLLIIQKINPFILIFFLLKSDLIHKIMFIYVVVSAWVGAVGGLTQSSLRKIIAYSSIAHLSWVLATMMASSWAWLMYFIAYAFVLATLVVLLSYSEMSTLTHVTTMNKSYFSFIVAVSILSLGGMPPFTGFLPKFMVTQQLMHTPEATLLLPLLAGTFISLFFYARVLLTCLVLSSYTQCNLHASSKTNSTLLNLNLVGLLLPGLCLLVV